MTTLAQKLIAEASGQENVAVGDVVICNVNLAMIHDSGGPRRENRFWKNWIVRCGIRIGLLL
jgi:homoaconitase/3-isopropylmalate dehydratase large subunit